MDSMDAILTRFGLEAPDRVTEIKPDGAWRIDHAEGSWVLSRRQLYGPDDSRPARFEAAARLMTALHEAGQPWVPARPTREGGHVVVEGDHLYHVIGFAEGESGLLVASPDMIPAVGRILGAFHRFQETSHPLTLPAHDFTGMTQEGLDLRRRELRDFDVPRKPSPDAVDEAEARFERLSSRIAGLPTGLIHMDLSAENMVMRDGMPEAVIDFEAYAAPYLLDVGFAALYWTVVFDTETRDSSIDRDRLGDLLRSYVAERPLTHEERRALKDAIVWCAVRWWSRQAPHTADRPDARLHSRHDAYICCLDLDPEWLDTCVA